MERIPGLGLVQNAATSQGGSLRDAARPWSNVAEVGKSFSDIGNTLASYVVKQNQLAEKRQEAEMELEFGRISEQHALDVIQDPNMTQDEATKKWEENTLPLVEKYANPDNSAADSLLPERVRAKVQDGFFNTAKSVALRDIQKTKDLGRQLMDFGIESDNPEMIDRALEIYASVLPEDQLDVMRSTVNQQMINKDAASTAASNPFYFNGILEDRNLFNEMFPGITDADFEKIKSINRTAMTTTISDAYNKFEDGVTPNGGIKTENDIDIQFGEKNGYPPRVAADMKAKYRAMFNLAEKNKYTDPKEQERAFGQLSESVKSLPTLVGDNYLKGYSNARYLVDALPDSPTKTYYKEKLADISANNTSKSKTKMDLVMDRIDTIEKSQGLGPMVPEPKSMETSQAIRANFLLDAKKMKLVGLDEDQIDEIKKAKTDNVRVDLFQKYYDPKKLSKKTAPIDAATADAIRRGETDIGYVDPESYDTYEAATNKRLANKGRLADALIRFVQNKPDATDDELVKVQNETLKAIYSEQAAESAEEE